MSDDTNQDVTTPTNNDGNYHSFDDLEQSTETRSDTELMKEASEVATKEDVKEAVKEVKAEESVSEKTVDENLEDAGDTAVEEMIEEIKKLEAKFGEERIEIPQDALFNVKIDGEEQEISLNDLRNNYSGKVAWDKKYSELGNEKRSFEEEKTIVEKYINEFAELSGKGDHLGAMEYLATISGQNPLDFRRSLRNQIIEDHKSMLEMDEFQKEAYETKEENEFLKRQQESQIQRGEEQQSVYELRNQLEEFQKAQSVSDEELVNAYDELNATYEGEVDISTIQEYIGASRAYAKTEEALSAVTDSTVSDEVYNQLAEVVMENPDFSNEEIGEIFKEAYPELVGSPKKLAKKAINAAKAGDSNAETNSEKVARNKMEEFYSFDDL